MKKFLIGGFVVLLSSCVLAQESQEFKVSWVRKVNNRDGWYKTSAVLPQFPDDSTLGQFAANALKSSVDIEMNRFIGEIEKEKQAPRWENTADWRTFVSLASDSFISTYSTFSFFTGGAHPNLWQYTHNFAKVDGTCIQIRHEQIFGEKDIDTFVIPALRKLGAMDVPDELTPEQRDRFVITPGGITWLFDPYEAGPYVQGKFEVKLKWSELRPYLLADSPVSFLFTKN